MVARQHYPSGTPNGYPACGLEGLGGFVDEESGKPHAIEQTRRAAYEGRGYDMCGVEEVLVDAYLKLRGAGAETIHLLMPLVGAAALGGAKLPDGLADAPEVGIVGMRFKPTLIREGKHLIVDARGVAETQYVDSPIDKALAYPVDGHVALGAHEHLRFAPKGLGDGFDECCGLASARRTMDNGDILRAQHLVDGRLLGRVEIGKTEGRERELPYLAARIDEVAELGETSFGLDGAVEGLEHGAVGGFVERQHHPGDGG